jgi:uncharacterized protein YkwD
MKATPTSRFRRLLAGTVLTVGLLAGLTATTPASARPSESATPRATAEVMTRTQSIVVRQINNSRSNNGRRGIATNGLMNQRAMKWARHLVNCQCLEHRRPPYGVTRGWCVAAENVGRSGDGGTLGATHLAFMKSTGHRANILRRGWSDLGVGVARDGRGEYFVVHVFADYTC